MSYFHKLWEYKEGEQYICYLCKASVKTTEQFIRHVLRHIPDPSRFSCNICETVRGSRRSTDFGNKRHTCFVEGLDYTLQEHKNNPEDCREILSKAYLIPTKDFDRCLKEWQDCGEPDSFNNRSNLSKTEIKETAARKHRRDVQQIEELVTLNFNPTGLQIGTGLPNPWSSYGHYLYLDYFHDIFKEACKRPTGELKGVKRCLDV